MAYSILFLSVYTILSGAQQGIITWLFREYVPTSRQDWIHAALHYGGVLIYLVLVGLAWYAGLLPLWALVAVAALARALLFDPSLNLSQSYFNSREGRAAEPLFKVGTVAAGDKVVRWLAARLSLAPDRLRLFLWLASLAAAVSAIWVAAAGPTF